MTTPATTPADGELLQRIAENDPSWVLKYLEQNTRFDVPRIRELFEFAKTQAVAALATPSPGKADAEDAAPKDRLDELFKSRMTPYGMLVRALRIVANTSLYEMAQAHGVKPSHLSAMEMGRKPVTIEDVQMADRFFADCGVQGTIWPLTAAMHANAAIQHASDCAVHNAPAYPAGPCDCGAVQQERHKEARS